MSFTGLFFESPLQLTILSFCLFSAALLIRKPISDPSSRRMILPAALAMIAALFLIQHLVVTERERVLSRLADLISAIERRDPDAVGDFISADYSCNDMGKEALLEQVSDWLKLVQVRDTRVRRCDVVFDADTARLELGAMATVSIRGAMGQMHVGRWEVLWRREQDQWSVVAIIPIEIDNMMIGSLERLDGYIR